MLDIEIRHSLEFLRNSKPSYQVRHFEFSNFDLEFVFGV